MKTLASLLIVACSWASAGLSAENDLNLIPWPARVTEGAGSFTLTARTGIVADPAFTNEAAQLRAALSLPRKTSDASIVLKKGAGLAAEGYQLDVTPTGVKIVASTAAGAFYGCQTLRQLLHDRNIPCVSIQDEPRMAWRGLMLDVSRHFYDKAEIKAVLDQMAVLKLNVFHWHLTDDHGWRIEIKKYPKLTTIGAWRPLGGWDNGASHIVNGQHGGFYTQDDIREVVAYAAARHIRIVPEIEMPGHASAAATAYPELSPANGWTPKLALGGEYCAALCVGRKQTVTFCKDVLMEVMELFPSKEIHVGGDEVFYKQWEPCPDMWALKKKLGAKDWEAVQVAFGNDIAAFLAAHGRTAIFWDNIYRQTADKRGIHQFWRSMGPARDFANAGYDVLLSPYIYYFAVSRKLEDTYRYDPFAIGAKPEAQSRLRGIEGCMWTEHVVNLSQLQNAIYPYLIAVAETGWTPQEKKDWESFQKRLVHFVLPHRSH